MAKRSRKRKATGYGDLPRPRLCRVSRNLARGIDAKFSAGVLDQNENVMARVSPASGRGLGLGKSTLFVKAGMCRVRWCAHLEPSQDALLIFGFQISSKWLSRTNHPFTARPPAGSLHWTPNGVEYPCSTGNGKGFTWSTRNYRPSMVKSLLASSQRWKSRRTITTIGMMMLTMT